MTPRKMKVILRTETSETVTVITTVLSDAELYRRGEKAILGQLEHPSVSESPKLGEDDFESTYIMFVLNLHEIDFDTGLKLWARMLSALERA